MKVPQEHIYVNSTIHLSHKKYTEILKPHLVALFYVNKATKPKSMDFSSWNCRQTLHVLV